MLIFVIEHELSVLEYLTRQLPLGEAIHGNFGLSYVVGFVSSNHSCGFIQRTIECQVSRMPLQTLIADLWA